MKSKELLNKELTDSIEFLAQKRSGGRINIRGINYQLNFSIYKAIALINEENRSIRLEGIEDLDIIHKLQIDFQEFYQLKYTNRKLSASDFWKLKIVQNFLEAHIINPEASFFVVINQKTTDKNLECFVNHKFNQDILSFWQQLIIQLKSSNTKFKYFNTDIVNIELFLSKISIQVIDEEYIINSLKKSIITQFNISNDTYFQYIKALFYHFFQWARFGTTIQVKDIKTVINTVKYSIGKGVINPAIQNNWLERVMYLIENKKNYNDYYEGKPGRPIHIALGLPVDRPKWEKLIIEQINDNDITVIRSSSGQGKSTLAWKVCKIFNDSKKYDIYELHNCKEGSEGAISEYLKLCIETGQAPLIVIDGISSKVESWVSLVNRLANEPIRFLITAREEDWKRVKHDIYQLKIKEIEINFDKSEAKDIYYLLRKKNLIHINASEWQTAWERVAQKKLLIEYIFLLTYGQMLEVRLQNQVKVLNEQKDSITILQALRLIALADKIGIKIETQKLIKYLFENYPPSTDRSILLLPLEKEYYLRFDQKYIEGLHPVRSEHLTNILHNDFLPCFETLLELVKIISEENIFELSQNISAIVQENFRNIFFLKFTKILITLSPSAIVGALNGVWGSEVLSYWQKHENIFNNVYNKGGGIFLAMSTSPFNKSNDLLNELNIPELNFEHIIEAKTKLPAYNFEKSALKQLIVQLHSEITEKSYSLNTESGHLFDWFNLFNLPLPETIINNFDSDLWNILHIMPISDSMRLAQSIHKANSHRFKAWVLKNKKTIISVLKQKTKSVTIKETSDENIHIEYILEEDNYSNSNEESVNRAKYIKSWLPIYKCYSTDLIIVPLFGEHYVKYLKMNAHKTLSYEILYDDFTISVNSIWNDTISNQYQYKSAFEWQKSWVSLREEGVRFIKSAIRILELRLELNSSGEAFEKSIKILIDSSSNFRKKSLQVYDFFQLHNNNSADISFKEDLENLKKWNSTLSVFVNQYPKISLLSDLDNLHITLINLDNLLLYLPKMQQSFDNIIVNTISFFNVSEITKEESKYYKRLNITSLYYTEHLKVDNNYFAFSARKKITEWWESKIAFEMYFINSVLDVIAEGKIYNLQKPSFVLEEEYQIRTLVIGIEGIKFKYFLSNELDQFIRLLSLLFPENINISFIILVFIESGMAIEKGVRLNKTLLEITLKETIGEDVEYNIENTMPIPIYLNKYLISPLGDIEFKTNPSNDFNDSVVIAIQFIWRLSEFNCRINKNNSVEALWLEEIRLKYNEKISKCLSVIKIYNIELHNTLDILHQQVILEKIVFSAQECANLIESYLATVDN